MTLRGVIARDGGRERRSYVDFRKNGWPARARGSQKAGAAATLDRLFERQAS